MTALMLKLRALTRQQLDEALVDICEALYPAGNCYAEWSTDTLEEVARILRDIGLTPDVERPPASCRMQRRFK